MLTNLLPGLRDLRTPLATGYLYLAALWIVFGGLLPDNDSATGLIARIYELDGVLGTSTLLAGLSFVASVLGSMLTHSTVSFRRLRGWKPFRWPRRRMDGYTTWVVDDSDVHDTIRMISTEIETVLSQLKSSTAINHILDS